MTIGAKLKKLREQKRYSQQDIADMIGVSQRTYSNIESDKSDISIDKLAELSKILEFDLIDFLQEQGFVINQTNTDFKDNSNALVINNISEKLIQQYEAQIQQFKEINRLQKEQLEFYKNQM